MSQDSVPFHREDSPFELYYPSSAESVPVYRTPADQYDFIDEEMDGLDMPQTDESGGRSFEGSYAVCQPLIVGSCWPHSGYLMLV
jgi:hypothetical protein